MADNKEEKKVQHGGEKKDAKPAAAPASEKPAAEDKAPQRREPAWNKVTWMSMANVRLGVPAPVVAAALSTEPAHALLTEADVLRLVKKITEQSL